MPKAYFFALLLSVFILETGYSQQAVAQDNTPETTAFLLVGDTGAHHDYLRPRYYEQQHPKTRQQIEARFIKYWEEKTYGNFTGFRFPPFTYHAGLGGYIAASGLYPVAASMNAYCSQHRCDFAVMLGDNIYEKGATLGGDGKVDALRFADMFTKPYSALGAGNDDFKIYVTLGNHDWGTSREGAMAQVKFMQDDKKFYMDGIFYSVKPPAAKGDVEIFVVDSEMLLHTVDAPKWKLDSDGYMRKTEKMLRHKPWIKPQTKAEKNMLRWLEKGLKNSKAKWKFVAAHHPLWSAGGGGKFSQGKALRKLMMPMLCRYADAYFAGHEHTLEIAEDSCETALDDPNVPAFTHIVSGAGAKQRAVNPTFMQVQPKQFKQFKPIWHKGMIWGFTQISLHGDTATVQMFTTPNDGSGKVESAYQHSFKHRSAWLK